MKVLLLATLAGCLVLAMATTPPPLCGRPATKPEISDGVMPRLLSPLTIDVEFYEKDSNSVQAIKMMYSKAFKLARMTCHVGSQKTDVIYYHKDNEILTFTSSKGQRPSCTVDTNLMNSTKTFSIGNSGTADTYGFPSPLAFLHFEGVDAAGDEIFPNYIGTSQIRGKVVNEFRSCQTWMLPDGTKFIAEVTHYFLAKADNWTVPEVLDPLLGRPSVSWPVMYRVKGRANNKDIEHTYSIFSTLHKLPDYAFETPEGVACHDRKVDIEFPELPSYMKFTKEVIDRRMRQHYFVDEIYDLDMHLGVYRQQKQVNSLKDIGRIVTINDYRTGYSYRIDEKRKTCDIRYIQSRRLPFGDVRDGFVHEYSPDRFFLGNNGTFTYLGQRTVRGFLADTWVAETEMEDLGKVTVEWYFAPEYSKSWNDGLPVKHRIPVKLRIWTANDIKGSVIQEGDSAIDWNILHVDFTKLRFDDIKVDPCWTTTITNHFQLIFKRSELLFRQAPQLALRWHIAHRIADTAFVNWLRVGNLDIFYANGKDAIVQFNIWEYVAPTANVTVTRREADLSLATNLMTQVIRGGIFYLDIPYGDDGKKKTTVYAEKYGSVHTEQIPIVRPSNHQ